MKTTYKIAIAAFTALLAGCSSDSGSAARTGGRGAAKRLRVGIVFDSGGRGDKSFNDSAWAGAERARKDFGVELKPVDSRQEKDYESNLTTLADGGADLIFAVGFAQSKALNTVAPKYPATKFAIIDAEVSQPNVRSILFNEEQGSFLAGYLAALVTKTGKIGFVGGKRIPLIEKFEAGYIAGARTARPGIQVLPSKYTESWDDTSLGKASATVLFNQGADVVYHAAGRSGLGVIAAAKQAGKYAIGVDSDQDAQAPGTVLTSMVKRVDVAVYDTIKAVRDGAFEAGVKRYDLQSGGVGLTDFKYTKNQIGAANLAKLAAVRERVASGQIKVPSTLAELASFVPPSR